MQGTHGNISKKSTVLAFRERNRKAMGRDERESGFIFFAIHFKILYVFNNRNAVLEIFLKNCATEFHAVKNK